MNARNLWSDSLCFLSAFLCELCGSALPFKPAARR
jgi:hypothetical protein